MGKRRVNRTEVAKTIERMFKLAKTMLKENEELAQRYVEIARKLSMKERVRIPKEYKLFLCKNCKKFIYPGVSCRVRIKQRREPHVAITCLLCGTVTRIPILKRAGA
jgi:ribonuclease P protein subunit RPR2